MVPRNCHPLPYATYESIGAIYNHRHTLFADRDMQLRSGKIQKGLRINGGVIEPFVSILSSVKLDSVVSPNKAC